jgi:dUTP pyrophosphatase
MSQDTKLLIKLTHKDAKLPTRAYLTDSGYDLYACEDITLTAGFPTIVHTGVEMAFPKGYYGEIHTRSSQGFQGIRNHLGIVDEEYRGEISPIMIAPRNIVIKKGMKVAQLIIKKRYDIPIEQVTELPESTRGKKGFGSSGI